LILAAATNQGNSILKCVVVLLWIFLMLNFFGWGMALMLAFPNFASNLGSFVCLLVCLFVGDLSNFGGKKKKEIICVGCVCCNL